MATAASIAAQSLRPFWLVVDGGSTDGTPGRLGALPRPPDLVISEPDAGISDAFNKGLRLAGERPVLFLNAGDGFVDGDALAGLMGAWDRSRYRWICGGIAVHDAHGRNIGQRLPGPAEPARRLLSRGNRIAHPAVLAKAAWLRGLGGFDLGLRYSMDYDLWARAIAAGQCPQTTDRIVTAFALGGRSGDVAARMREDRLIRKRHRLSDGALAEAWLSLGGYARRIAGPFRRSRWTYALNRRLGW